jgi:TrwC relaxase
MAKVKDDNKTGHNFMFDHLSCNDYYSENEKVVGYWHGKLAEAFGVSGNEIAAAEFVSIQKSENPWCGGKLTSAVLLIRKSIHIASSQMSPGANQNSVIKHYRNLKFSKQLGTADKCLNRKYLDLIIK